MSFEEEFDSIMRQKAEGAQFPVDEANFEKLAALLDGNKAAVIRPLWKKLWLPAAALLVTGSALLIWNQSESNELAKAESPLTLKKDFNTKEKIQVPEETALAINATGKSSSAPATELMGKPSAAAPLQEEKHTSTETKKEMLESAAAFNDQFVNPSPVTGKSSIAAPLSQNQTPVTDLASPADEEDQTAAQAPFASFANATKNPENDTKDGAEMKQDFSKASLEAPPSVTKFSESQANAQAPVADQASEVLLAEWLPAKQLFLTNELNEDIQANNINILKRYEDDYYNSFGVRHFIALDGGVHYGLGWTNGQTKDGAGTNYFAGLEFGRYMTKKFTISAGLQYYNFTNIVLPYYTSIKKAYGFGYTDAISTVTTDQLNYLGVPLKFSYSLNQTISAGVGFNAAYLLSSHTRVDNYKVSDGQRSAVISQGSNQVYDGTKDYNLMGSVFLKVKMQDRISGFAELQYGLTDVFKDYTKIKINQRSTGLRFGVNILLFEK